MKKQNPVEYVIAKFGGTRATARAIGLTPSAVSQWGRKGTIPSSSQRLVLMVAMRLGLDITPVNLVYGSSIYKGRRRKP